MDAGFNLEKMAEVKLVLHVIIKMEKYLKYDFEMS